MPLLRTACSQGPLWTSTEERICSCCPNALRCPRATGSTGRGLWQGRSGLAGNIPDVAAAALEDSAAN